MRRMERESLIEAENETFSIRHQCKILGVNRSNIYYEASNENAYNLDLMKLLDEEYTRHPFKGVLKMVEYLKELGHEGNPKCIKRLLRLMGIERRYIPERT